MELSADKAQSAAQTVFTSGDYNGKSFASTEVFVTHVPSWQVVNGADHGRAGFGILRPGITHAGPCRPTPHRQVRSAMPAR